MSHPEAKANIFNKYFAQQTHLQTGDEEPFNNKPEVHSEINTIRITYLSVKQVLDNLKVNKASGPDNISPRVLAKTAKEIAPSLAIMFNFSMQTSSFPGIWKLAHVTPLFKNKGEKHSETNYRPISLLSCIGKVMERCVFNHVFNYLLEEKLLSKFQGAYTPNTSTTTQLIDIYHHILTALDKGKDIRFIFLDISKAFDKLWHKGALYKMKKLGIKGKLLDWFEDYLKGRKQKVVVDGSTSQEEDLHAGVPQGSILGPMIFLIYINDLAEAVESHIRLYADDTSLYIDYLNPQTASEHLQRDIQKIEAWAVKWYVKFNPTKTESLTFSRKTNIRSPHLIMGNTIIEEVTHHKHLGITLQQNAKWHIHIQEILTKAKKKVDILRGLMYRLNRKSIEKLYISYIRPILEYGDTVWDGCSEYEKKELEKVQQSALRVILGAKKGTSHDLLYAETNLEKLDTRRTRHKLIQFFKIHHGLAPSTLTDLVPCLTKDKTQYKLRKPINIGTYQSHTESLHKSFFPSTIRSWNSLPDEVKSIPTLEQFKEAVTPEKKKVPGRFYHGERKFQILHNRLRLRCSNLAEDLYNINVKDSPLCECRRDLEDAEHFILECPRYQHVRDHLKTRYMDIFQYNIETLLHGDDSLPENINIYIFSIVHGFIKLSKRFDA